MELAEEFETGQAISQLSPVGSSAFTWDPEALPAASSAQSESPVLALSNSKEVDTVSIEAGDVEDSPPLSPAYGELVKVVTRGKVKHRLAG